ncbi:MAG: hypothetical protein IMW99_00180 [Firmicutes bacterium]|nr:hypothetical protein [Bacillota bacterium]
MEWALPASRHRNGPGPGPDREPPSGRGTEDNLRAWAERAAGWLDLPGEAVLSLPKVTVIGFRQVHVENHRGVAKIAPEQVQVRVPQGVITIHGQKLAIGAISRDWVVVDGLVEHLDFGQGGGPR